VIFTQAGEILSYVFQAPGAITPAMHGRPVVHLTFRKVIMVKLAGPV